MHILTHLDCTCRLQQAVDRALAASAACDASRATEALRCVCAGVEMVFGQPAALNAAFGRANRVGLDVVLMDKVMCAVAQLCR